MCQEPFGIRAPKERTIFMKKIISLIVSLALCIASFSCIASAADATPSNEYDSIVVGTITTTDEDGNEVSRDLTLADCAFFDVDGHPVDVADAIIIGNATRSSVTHYPSVSLKSGYMMRYGDYYCVTANPVTLACTLGSAAKVAFGYSYTSNPTSGAETYTATADSTAHAAAFYVPSSTYYMFYCTNISPAAVTLKTFTISY